jgi:hypothetical protein
MSWLILVVTSPLWIFTAVETEACMNVKVRDKNIALCDWSQEDFRQTYCKDCGSIDYVLLKEVSTDNYIKKVARNRYHAKRTLHR